MTVERHTGRLWLPAASSGPRVASVEITWPSAGELSIGQSVSYPHTSEGVTLSGVDAMGHGLRPRMDRALSGIKPCLTPWQWTDSGCRSVPAPFNVDRPDRRSPGARRACRAFGSGLP